jgi:hypothetical protein
MMGRRKMSKSRMMSQSRKMRRRKSRQTRRRDSRQKRRRRRPLWSPPTAAKPPLA